MAQRKIKRTQAARLMQRFDMIDLIPVDLHWAMQQQMTYELSHGVGMMDCLIASVSQRLQMPLYTHNLKHFTPLIGNYPIDRFPLPYLRFLHLRTCYFNPQNWQLRPRDFK